MDYTGDNYVAVSDEFLKWYEELQGSLDGYDEIDYNDNGHLSKEGDYGVQICYENTVKSGHGLLIGLYLIASFIYYHTFSKSLRIYLIMKSTWIIIISLSTIAINQMVIALSRDGFFEGPLTKYRSYFEKLITCGNFFVCNLNFMFLYEIYSMVCSSISFSKSLFPKLLIILVFSLFPTASTFRYHTLSHEDKEPFSIEISYRLILFLIITFFIYKVRKAFIKSLNLRTNGRAGDGRLRQTSGDSKKSTYF